MGILLSFKSHKWILLLIIIFLVGGVLFPSWGLAEPLDSLKVDEVHILRGDLEAVKVYNMSRVALSNPEVADFANIDNQEILLVGRRPGETSLFIWDEHGKRSLIIRVYNDDLIVIKKRIEKLIKSRDIKEVKLDINEYEGKIIVTGKVSDEDAEKLNNILDKFYENIINYVQAEKMEDLVEINAQIAEVNASLDKKLGFDWTTGSGSDAFNLNYAETLPAFDGSIGDFFKIGDFRRTNALLNTVNALIIEGKGRVLSKPKLVVKSGSQASFLVGGEIPIRTTTASAGGGVVQENVNFKSFGISLTITPTIRHDEKIDITLGVQVSDVDRSNAVGGDVAFVTRSAQTDLLLDDNQTIVLAGLIRHAKSEKVKRIPFISSIPVVGTLFRNKTTPTPEEETELVISLTPTVLEQKETQKDKTVVESGADEGDEDEEEIEMSNQSSKDSRKGKETALDDESADHAGVRNQEKQMLSDKTGAAAEGKGAIVSAESGDGRDHKTKQKGPRIKNDGEENWSSSEVSLGSSQVDIQYPSNIIPYVKNVQKRILAAIAYPSEAQFKGLEGTVKLTIQILSDGTLYDVWVKESSGHRVFDKDALNTAQLLAPFPPFPMDVELDEVMVTIPIVYSREIQGVIEDLGYLPQ